MAETLKGNAHVYSRDDINTDEIIPARYLNSDKEEELAEHAMEDLDKEFINKVKGGDFIIAGENFGCGSSREHAIWALRGSGIRAVFAKSFARIFYRNAVNNGFLAIECNYVVKKVKNGNELEINIKKGKIKNLTKKEEYKFAPLPEFTIELMEAGGLLEYIKKK
ncbi:3-isopropylmalate dehydratase small subunit [Candidatus Woesearchaeota archaeon]|nr:3-isopropylmalate dehydratase small subunit [Candidatus Woesearchaeota archaeon]